MEDLREEDRSPINIDEFGRRHALLYSRLAREGSSPELDRALAVLWETLDCRSLLDRHMPLSTAMTQMSVAYGFRFSRIQRAIFCRPFAPEPHLYT